MRAVVKADGYRWGAHALVSALEDVCPAFCVADAQELFDVRRVTKKPIVVLGSIDPAQLQSVLDADGIPTIATSAELALAEQWARRAGRQLRVRVGVQTAAGWSGLDLSSLRSFAPALASSGAQVEAWAHVTDLGALDEQLTLFEEGVALLREGGARVVALDAASTLPAAVRGAAGGDSLRLGVGLFGATGGVAVGGISNAIRIDAPVMTSTRVGEGMRIGYGNVRAQETALVASIRCGYSDGYPKSLAGTGDILAVGMQYVQMRTDASPGDVVRLLDGESSLDDLAERAQRLVHEIVTTLGMARTREHEE